MGLRLSYDRAPRAVPLPGGASLTMRPANSIETAAAESAATDRIRRALAGVDALADLNVPTPAAAALQDRQYLVGLSTYLAAVALASLIVTGWSGIVDDAGGAVAYAPDLLPALLLEDGVLRAFSRAAFSLREAIVAEGEGLARSSAGSPAGAPNTAAAARSKGSPAPPESGAPTASAAPRSSTGPAAPKAPRLHKH